MFSFSKAYFNLIFCSVLFFLTSQSARCQEQLWRSELYPFEWKPGYAKDGKFLHDFSYAGYHRGEKALPNIQQNILNVTLSPFNADNTGTEDATAAIQAAIDSVATLGNGVVYLPEGTYLVKPNESHALLISHDSTVLRGDGPDKTFILNTDPYMRSKTIITLSPGSNGWYSPNGSSINFTKDAIEHDTVIYLANASHFTEGDRIILTTDFTADFIEEHKMTGKWTTSIQGTAFCRTVKSVDAEKNTILIDIPIRYYMKMRDKARAYRIREQLTECGIESLSIGNLENLNPGRGESDYNTSGTAAYEVHASHAIDIRYAENCWITHVNTFKPSANTLDIHVLSNTLQLYQSRLITVDSCILQKPLYEGGGGNGYMFTLRGNDCLISNSQAIHSRHNYDFKKAYSNGNVIYNCLSKDSKYASDFHMHLSMSNLFDSHTVDNDFLEAVYRPYGSIEHGHSTTQSVFWNTTGEKYHGNSNRIISSGQWGYGYVIGTQGNATGVSLPTGNNTEPKDHLEGEATGGLLRPVSLYKDQLNRRLFGLTAVDSTAWDAPEIILASPVNDEVITTGELTMEVTIAKRAHNVAKVVFLVDDEPIGEVATPPYIFSWPEVTDGCYKISAYAIGHSGFISNTEHAEIVMGKGCEKSFYSFAFELPGKIEAEHFNKGKNGLSYFDSDEPNQGGAYRLNEPVDIERCSDTGAGFNIGWIADNEYVRYIVDVTETGTYDIHFRTASENSGSIAFEFNRQNLSGSIEVPTSGGWQSWKTEVAEGIELEQGQDTIQLTFTGSFNLNYFEVMTSNVLNAKPPLKSPSIYPNPAGGYLYIQAGNSSVKRYTIYSLLGQTILNEEINNQTLIKADIRAIPPGTYLVKVQLAEGEISRILIKR